MDDSARPSLRNLNPPSYYVIVKKIPLILTLAATLSLPSLAQVYTDPVGFTTISEPTATAGNAGTLFLSLNLLRPSAFQSRVATVTTSQSQSTFTFSSVAFSANQFNGPANSHYVEVLNGPGAGTVSPVIATGSGSVTVKDDLSAIVTGGETSVKIRPNWTFATAFGANNSANFLGAANSNSADVITVGGQGYFYNSGTSRWETTANAPANDLPIPADLGLSVTRRGSDPLTFKLVGDVKTGQAGLYVEGGASDTFNLLANPFALDSVMLKDSGLYNPADPSASVTGAAKAEQADIVRIQDPVRGSFDDFFYSTEKNQWMTGFTDASLIRIPSGSSVAIIRRAGNPDFQWYAPQPLMALSNEPIPLRLLSAVSRKTHGTFGNADVNLPLTGTAGVEPRRKKPDGSHLLVFEFSTDLSSATPSVSLGSVTSSNIQGNKLSVSLSDVPDGSKAIVTLDGVQDTSGQSLPQTAVNANFLLGDVNSSGNVSAFDFLDVKNSLHKSNALGRFRADINLSNTFSAFDFLDVKNNLHNKLRP